MNFSVKQFLLQVIAVIVVITLLTILIVCFFHWVINNYDFFKGLNVKAEYLEILVSLIVAASTMCYTAVYMHKDKNRELALNYVTDRRVDWINETRGLVGTLCRYIWEYINLRNLDEGTDELYGRIGGAIVDLYVRFNFDDPNDRIIIKLLDNMYLDVREYRKLYVDEKQSDVIKETRNRIEEYLKFLTMHSQIYLKIEWEKVKEETFSSDDIVERNGVIKRKLHGERKRLYEKRLTYNKEFRRGTGGLDIESVYETLVKDVREGKYDS